MSSIDAVGPNRAVVLEVSGEVDLCTAPQLASRLRSALRSGREVIVDLEAVTFMDCAGLRVLVEAALDAGADERRFGVTPGPRQVQRLFELARVHRTLRIVPAPSTGRE